MSEDKKVAGQTASVGTEAEKATVNETYETTGADHSLDNVTPKEEAPANIVFVGVRHRNGKEERLKEAPETLISGPERFCDLPNSEKQLEGFYYERAAELCRAFPGLYKPFIKKGE